MLGNIVVSNVFWYGEWWMRFWDEIDVLIEFFGFGRMFNGLVMAYIGIRVEVCICFVSWLIVGWRRIWMLDSIRFGWMIYWCDLDVFDGDFWCVSKHRKWWWRTGEYACVCDTMEKTADIFCGILWYLNYWHEPFNKIHESMIIHTEILCNR